ncbi:ATP synthase F1 complex assembly factor 2 [Nymphaea thermarum]|nr:ATP synthase F1 complex assembly factor 2 [Nymphaea thermarum]
MASSSLCKLMVSRMANPLRIMCTTRAFSTIPAQEPEFAAGEEQEKQNKEKEKDDDKIYVHSPVFGDSSVAMPMSFMTGSIIGKRFYTEVTTRMADDGNGWTETDGIRPFTMPLMRLACTALERVPLTRPKVINNLMKKFHQDLVFCRAPDDNDLTSGVSERQVEVIDPFFDWVEKEFGFRPLVYTSLFGGKQDDGLVAAVQDLLKKTNNWELASIDAMAAAAHSLLISLGIFRGHLQIEEAIKLIRLEEDMQVDKWGFVEGGHDVDIADLRVQISSAAVLLGLSQLQ